MLRINELKHFFGSVFWIVFDEGKAWWLLRFNRKYPRRSACSVDLHHRRKHFDAALNLNTRIHFFFWFYSLKGSKKTKQHSSHVTKGWNQGKALFLCWIPSLNHLLRIIGLKHPNTFFGCVFWTGVQKGKVWWFLRFNKKCPRRSACFVDISSQEKFWCW